ncbi:LEA type 2 family protein [Halorussus litoreus]|uniref:LEA type 2 family protein n=1 Tax=Halorussus litoreus TaxID=1710536 RepID=UPI0018E4DEA1|nr:LEA type 2 family protein [Halorussus litoreus]
MSILGSTAGKVVAVLFAGMVVTTAGIGAALTTGVVSVEPPTVESIDNEWGEVTDERTGIRTNVVVNNPNGFGVPGVVDVSYDVAMNDVAVASGSSDGLSLSSGQNELTLDTHIDNGKIPAWWASHINNGERTTVSVQPSVEAPFVSRSLPSQDRTFATDMLSSFDSTEAQSVEAGGRTLLTVSETDASWGRATESETPLSFSATVENPNDAPVRFSTLGYRVSMNDLEVANGTTDGGVEVGANSEGTIEIDSTMDNSKLDEWWVSHLRNDERTVLDVQVFAVAETDEGTQRIPLEFMSQRVEFETDILGGGGAQTTALDSENAVDFEPPTVESVERDWTATDSGTQFSNQVVVNNPNDADSALGDVSLDADYRVDLNDVTVLDDESRTDLAPGRNELAFGGEVSDPTITEWWVSHVENGERTDVTTDASVRADLGFTEVPVEVPADDRTFETDMLAGFDGAGEEVTAEGRTLATLGGTTAEWGDPTMDRTPMVVEGEVTNERSRPLTVVSFGYEVEANDVVLADNETRVGEEIPGGTTRTVDATGYLDNEQIPAWWVSHLENDERSELSVSYYVTVEMLGQQYTVELDSMSYNQTVETNAFGGS